jgi:putative ABC transport system substrate-binding protein
LGAQLSPRRARAQQNAMPVIGYLNAGSVDSHIQQLRFFRQGLNEAGFVEGRNVAIEFRWAEGQYERLQTMATELVQRRVSVIAATGSTASALAAKAASTEIPIIFSVAADPVEARLVTSLNRPSGNLTGVTTLSAPLVPKRLELLYEAVPTATTIAVLLNPTRSNRQTPPLEIQAAARSLGLQLQPVFASTEREFDSAFEAVQKMRPTALVFAADALFFDRRSQLGALTLQHTIPAIHAYREFVAAGGLMGYGGNLLDASLQVGRYTGRILKGEKPADLPVHQITKTELILNLKTARALGVTFPLLLRGRADEVIE